MKAVDQFIWFYKCGKKDIETTKKGKNNSSKKSIFSYSHDDQVIWGAYYSQFKIDLTLYNSLGGNLRACGFHLIVNVNLVKLRGYRCYNGKDKDLIRN